MKNTPKTEVRIIKTSAHLEWFCEQLEKAQVIAYDIETTGLEEWRPDAKIVTLGVSTKTGTAVVLPLHHKSSPWKNPDYVLRLVKRYFEDTKKKYIAHNAKFDSRWMSANGVIVPHTFDTMLAAHLLDENRRKGLKELSREILGAKDYALDMKDNYNAPLKKLCIYNGKDCDYTLRLYYIFREQLKERPRIARIFKLIMMPASNVLTELEMGGLYLDPIKLRTRHDKAVRNVEALEKMLRTYISGEKQAREGKQRFNFNSPQQVGEWLFGDMGLPILEETKTGKPSTSESVLLRLEKEYEPVKYLLKYRKWRKYVSTYLGPWLEDRRDRRSRIHPGYKLYGTVTGRLSESGTALQQVPRDPFIRGILGAPPGWRLIEADYSQIELRIAAMLAGEHNMLRQFASGQDIHLTTASAVSGKSPETISKEERKKAKAVNFGFLYGMGAAKFVAYARDNYGVVVSDREAHRTRERFFKTYPRLRTWHERQRRIARSQGFVSSRIGRVRHLPDISSPETFKRAEAERQAINSPVQSLASDFMLISMIELSKKLPRSESRMVGSIHDAILFEVREESLDKICPIIQTTMENVPVKRMFGADVTVPIEVEVKYGQSWSEGAEVWSPGS